jgi:signal transduction histidine kinase
MRNKEPRPDTDQSMLRELVDGFAHEVKNPLTSIKVALKVLGEKMAEGDPSRIVIEQIHDEVGTINKALSDFVDFTRMSLPEASLADVNKPIEQALRRIQADCQRQDVRVEKLLSATLPAG